MKNSFVSISLQDYYTEISPAKRRDILLSKDFMNSFQSFEEYERVHKIFQVRHAQDSSLKTDKFLWNCVHLLELYLLKTKPLIKHIIRSEEYEVFDELQLSDLINDEIYEVPVFYEFFNSFCRYATTIKPTKKIWLGLKEVPQDDKKKLAEDIWKMSKGITSLIAEQRKILQLWNAAADFFIEFYGLHGEL